MNKEYLNVILAEYDEGNLVFFKSILKDLKIPVKVQSFQNGEDLMGYLNNKEALIPEVLFIDYNLPGKSSIEYLEEIKIDFRFSNMIIVVYSDELSEAEVEEAFVKGANIYMKKPGSYNDLKKVISEIIAINWQYHTSGLNRENFIMKV
ncbi:response regulator [Chryseobacterium populi]|uniref:Response regulator containing a CheY-like receiver domain and an HTH DNA-binding domain n=1 Tax=Chryseobacterium populi TaxID=1144316 RepID=J3CJQ0_9FLAO|nr:response regulator [Chryseobacterium populi]EJL72871.1 response regulator containing a CheY-like receiver domain and an HTH DNA-binding domain [Chryseobacterium populi]